MQGGSGGGAAPPRIPYQIYKIGIFFENLRKLIINVPGPFGSDLRLRHSSCFGLNFRGTTGCVYVSRSGCLPQGQPIGPSLRMAKSYIQTLLN